MDIAVVGAGAAGLFAAIWAGRTVREAGAGGRAVRVVALDGARTLGAKILVAGGGRCNVTHHHVDETAYAGSSRNAIKNVLRRFGVEETVAFFRERGVELKREDTGKLFPTSDDSRTVLSALISSARDAGVELVHPWRVERIERAADGAGFVITRRADSAAGDGAAETVETMLARRVILATGGLSLPKTGSDGHGHVIARSLGHSITGAVFPALVPLTVDRAATFIPELSGLTIEATVQVWSSTGKKVAEFTNSTLMTHFGLSGPGVLDVSRYFTDARRSDPGVRLTLNLTPGKTFEEVEQALTSAGRVSVMKVMTAWMPERLARAVCGQCRVEAGTMLANLRREERRTLAHAITRLEVPITGDRGYTHAEVTAGGVPLSEVHLATMASRVVDGLHLCGEICDVDGRIGGFNFQWAWASGYVAGVSAARAALGGG